MVNVFEGEVTAGPGRFAIVVSRFNESVTTRLLSGAVQTLIDRGVPSDQIDVAWVPGAFEIPTAASRLAHSRGYAAVICLGAVIRGETTHDHVLFGVLTCNTLEQAIVRSGGTVATRGKDRGQAPGNKGVDCAEAALEMVRLMEKLPGPTPQRSTQPGTRS